MGIFIQALWAVCPGIITGIVLAMWNRKQKQHDDESARADADKLESEIFRLDLEVATAQLSYAVAMAVKRGAANGEMDAAIARYDSAMEKFRKFERKKLAKGAAD